MLKMVPIEVYEEKDKTNLPPDSQNFRIGSRVYDILQKWNSPLIVFRVKYYLTGIVLLFPQPLSCPFQCGSCRMLLK